MTPEDKDRLSFAEFTRLQQDAVRRLADEYDVKLKDMYPVDHGDWCRQCHRGEATVESTDTGDRFCDAICALQYVEVHGERIEP